MFSRFFRSSRKSRKPLRRKPVYCRYRPVLEVLEARVMLVTRTWDGDSPFSNNWSDRFNWDEDRVIVGGEELVFPPDSDPEHLQSIEDLCGVEGSDTFETIHISGTGYSIFSRNFDEGCEGINASGPLLVEATDTTGSNFLNVKIKNSATFFIAVGGKLGYFGTIQTSLTKNGRGVLELDGDNTYTGPTLINEGVLRSSPNFSDFNFSFNSPHTVASQGVLDLNGNDEALSSLEGEGTVKLGSGTLRVAGGGTTFNGVITGTGRLLKTGPDTFTLAGNASNNGSYITEVEEGKLILSGTDGITRVPGPLVIVGSCEGCPVPRSAAVRLDGNDHIANTTSVTIGTSDLLDLNNFSDKIGSLRMTNADVTTGAGTLTLGGNVTIEASGSQSTIQGNLSLGGGTRTFTVADGGATNDLRISAIIRNGGLTKAGAGTLRLAAANTYTGATTVNDGTLVSSGPDFLADTTAVTVANVAFFNFGGGETIGSLAGGGTVFGTGPLTAGGNNSSTTFSGTISGDGVSFTKTGTGTLTLSGPQANTYTGTTTVIGGTLVLGKNPGINAIPGLLVIGDGSGTDTVRLTVSSQIANSAPVSINSSGLLDLNGRTDTIGPLTMNGGSVTTGGGTLGLGGDVTTNAAANSAIISGNLSLGGATRTFTVNDGSTVLNDLIIGAQIVGSVGLTKAGTGKLRLNRANSYTGKTTVSAGEISIINGAALGPPAGGPAGGTTVSSGASLEIFSLTVESEELTLSGAGVDNTGALRCLSAECTWNGRITLADNATVHVQFGLLTSGGFVTAFIGAPSLTKIGIGTLRFSGASNNNYGGATFVNEGVLELAKSTLSIIGPLVIGDGVGGSGADRVVLAANNNLFDNGQVTINSSGRLDLSGFNDTIGPLTMTNGSVTTGIGTLTLNGDVTATTVSSLSANIQGKLSLGGATRKFTVNNGPAGFDMSINAVISDGPSAAGLIKAGEGVLHFTGSNSYSGTTNVNAGTLLVNGSQPASPVILTAGTLGGTGTTGPITATGGTISPGVTRGTLNVSGNVSFNNKTTFRIELNGPTAGLNHDQLNVNGDVTLDNTPLDAILSFTPAAGDVFRIIDNVGTRRVTGTFNGLVEGATFAVGGSSFRISYVGGNGNDVVLTVVLPDIRAFQATANGLTTLSVNYEILTAAPSPFDIGFYRSTDTVFGGDTLLDSIPINAAADRTVGVHTKTFTIGGGAGAIALPGAGVAETDVDYHILVVLDDLNVIAETDADPRNEDNTTVFSGVYHPAAGDVFVHGTAGIDAVTIASGSVNVTLNGVTTSYADADVAGLRIRTHAGNDTIIGTTAAKPIFALAGDGNDTVRGGSANDTFDGGAGSDTLDYVSTLGVDFIDIDFNTGTSRLVVNRRDTAGGVPTDVDTLVLVEVVSLKGGGNNDEINASLLSAADRTAAGMTNLTLDGGSGNDVLRGSDGNDTLKGSTENDVLIGNAGNDTMLGEAGNDTFLGMLGSDTIQGGTGTDTLDYQSTAANDFIDIAFISATAVLVVNRRDTAGGAPTEADTCTSVEIISLKGLGGNDDIKASLLTNADRTSAGVTFLTLDGGPGNDTLRGSEGVDTLKGIAGNDVLLGLAGNDSLLGGAGRDLLIGGQGTDTTNGEAGNDIVIGGTTSHDADLAALAAIMAEWTRTDLGYSDRVNHLDGTVGGGLNGVTLLNASKVFDDALAEALTGGTELDWFFAAASDTVSDPNNGGTEVITAISTAPAFQNRSVTSPIHEGGVATVTGAIKEPDAGDRFFLTVNWGDGSPEKTFKFTPEPGGTLDGRTISVRHRYRDDKPSGTSADHYPIHMRWTDGHGEGNTGDLIVTVNNVVPTVDAGEDTAVGRGHKLVRNGSFIDPGADRWTATVNYGDGSVVQPLHVSRNGRFKLHHRYEQPGEFRVVVTVRDDDGGIGADSFFVTVGSSVARNQTFSRLLGDAAAADLLFSTLDDEFFQRRRRWDDPGNTPPAR